MRLEARAGQPHDDDHAQTGLLLGGSLLPRADQRPRTLDRRRGNVRADARTHSDRRGKTGPAAPAQDRTRPARIGWRIITRTDRRPTNIGDRIRTAPRSVVRRSTCNRSANSRRRNRADRRKPRPTCRRYYNVRTKVLRCCSLGVIPAKARCIEGIREQILTSYVLDQVLKPRRPKDAVAVLGLTTSDLWPGEGWNFVFGQASLSDRVGVWSIARYGNLENPQMSGLVYRRTFLVAVHETGHMLGIQHCTAYECTMNGSNSLDEADLRRCGCAPSACKRSGGRATPTRSSAYKSLVEFAKEHDLKAEAGFWQRSLESPPAPARKAKIRLPRTRRLPGMNQPTSSRGRGTSCQLVHNFAFNGPWHRGSRARRASWQLALRKPDASRQTSSTDCR